MQQYEGLMMIKRNTELIYGILNPSIRLMDAVSDFVHKGSYKKPKKFLWKRFMYNSIEMWQ